MSHTVEWKVRVRLDEEKGTTTAQAVLDTGDTSMSGTGVARCAPGDRDVPRIGDEFAAGRALRDLGEKLLSTGEHDVEAMGAAPERRTSPVYGWSL
ncbi:DUF1876 domain-containing protein [Streptomyces sp. NPDC049577]|uniref:DUF1876 domain-containing protein n=1 Tax=Streptomyces sp. NPDC049577 TaxID=3155153 RepID=UPI00341ED352